MVMVNEPGLAALVATRSQAVIGVCAMSNERQRTKRLPLPPKCLSQTAGAAEEPANATSAPRNANRRSHTRVTPAGRSAFVRIGQSRSPAYLRLLKAPD